MFVPRKLYLSILLSFGLITTAWSQLELAGPLEGTLQDTTYVVTDSIFVLSGQTLVIEPGAVFHFASGQGFGISGTLRAIGTEEDSIYFLGGLHDETWGGIDITSSATDSSIISYCYITASHTSAIDIDEVYATITHCTLENNPGQIRGGAISIRNSSSPEVAWCTLRNNEGNLDGGNIYIYQYSSAHIHHCWIEGGVTSFGGGIYTTSSTPIIEHCTFVGNQATYLGGGIYAYASAPTVTNCTFYQNIAGEMGGGMLSFHFGPELVNNIFLENINGGFGVYVAPFDGIVRYNLFYGNEGGDLLGEDLLPAMLGEVNQVNALGDSCDVFHNLFFPPLLTNPQANDLMPIWASPAVDAGDPELPQDPDSTVVEIGSTWFPQVRLSGEQSGALEAANYLIADSITVPANNTLTLESGSIFRFAEEGALVINGELRANGAPGDSIIFTDTGTLGWEGIDMRSGASDSTLFQYCVITESRSSAIQAYQVSPRIFDSRLSHNISLSQRGGAFNLMQDAAAHIERCVISDNYGELDGGGVYCMNGADAKIIDCIIQNNASSFGGGIYANSADVTLTGTLVRDNYADWYGGGMYCYQDQGTTTRSVFSGNHADLGGGGINIRNSSMQVTNTTLYDNSAGTGAGGVHIFNDSDALVNSTLVAASDPVGIFIEESDDAAVTYSLVWDSEESDFNGILPDGMGLRTTVNVNGDSCDAYGNLSLNPLLVDPEHGDVHLQAGSPCINAGDPALPFDPDDTISDIGRYYRPYQAPCLHIFDTLLDFGEITIGDSIPPQMVRVANEGNCTLSIDSLACLLPDSVLWWEPTTFVLAPGDTDTVLVYWAPANEMELTGNTLSLYHNDPNLNSPRTLELAGYAMNSTEEKPGSLPMTTRLASAYPNPFNATTTLVLELATSTQVNLYVYNLLGQRVAVLIDQTPLDAGTHRITWNAREYANGAYFIVMKTGATTQVQRVLLLK